MRVMSANKFERFFRVAAGLNVDKQDLKRYVRLPQSEDLLPITKGLQESVDAFGKLDQELRPILEGLAALPPLDLACSVETEARLPEIAGGLSLALARTFKIIDPDLKSPQSEHWERSFRIFDLRL
jgi:hypothetical protein